MRAYIFTALLLSTSPSHAQAPGQKPKASNAPVAHPANDVTIRATIIAVRNVEATQFSAKQDLSGKPADALNALEALVAQRKATSVALPAVTAKSGQRAVSDSGKITLEVQSVVSPDGTIADINLAFDDNGHKIVTSFQVSNGGVKFLGSVQSPTDKAMTDYIFVRVSY
jgi:hypothetical protein